MNSGRFTKQPDAGFLISMNFANCLRTSETISSYTIAATKVSDGSDATSTVINSAGNAKSGSYVYTFVKAGTSGEKYKITFKATTNASPAATYEADVEMTVIAT